MLRYSVLVFGRRLTTFLSGRAKEVIEAYLLRYHIHNLTALFRRSLTHDEEPVAETLYPIKPFYGSDRELALLDSPEKVVALAAAKPMKVMVKEAFAAYNGADKDLFRFELSLDRQYLQLVWNAASKLSMFEEERLKKQILLPYVGIEAFVWALWLERYHGMAGPELAGILPLPRSILRPEVFVDIARAENVREAAKAVRGPLRPSVMEILDKDPGKDIAQWQRLARRIVWRRVRRRDIASFDLTTLLAALMKWEFIVDDLITVTRGKALGLEREKIEALLATKAA